MHCWQQHLFLLQMVWWTNVYRTVSNMISIVGHWSRSYPEWWLTAKQSLQLVIWIICTVSIETHWPVTCWTVKFSALKCIHHAKMEVSNFHRKVEVNTGPDLCQRFEVSCMGTRDVQSVGGWIHSQICWYYCQLVGWVLWNWARGRWGWYALWILGQ